MSVLQRLGKKEELASTDSAAFLDVFLFRSSSFKRANENEENLKKAAGTLITLARQTRRQERK